MGVVPHSLKFLHAHVHHVGGLPGRKMMELGSQQMYCVFSVPEASAAKSYFQQLNVEHTSVDLNGELGAVQLDLSQPIDKSEWVGAFDIVTDFGTSEHVGRDLLGLYNCRKFCHDCVRPGGLLLFMNPKTKNWPGHGFHFFTLDHYRRLSERGHYTLLEVSEHPTLGNSTDGWQVQAALIRKTPVPFMDFPQFQEVCEGTVFTD